MIATQTRLKQAGKDSQREMNYYFFCLLSQSIGVLWFYLGYKFIFFL